MPGKPASGIVIITAYPLLLATGAGSGLKIFTDGISATFKHLYATRRDLNAQLGAFGEGKQGIETMIALKQLRRGSRLVKGQQRARQKRLRKARKLGKT